MNNELNKTFADIDIPIGLHEKSRIGINKAKSEMNLNVTSSIRKRLLSISLAIALMVPTGVFAYQTLLADEFYGSFDKLKVHVVNATMEGYLLLDAKLQQAKGDLGEEEFNVFKSQLSVMTDAKVEYGGTNGNIDYSAVPSQRREEIKQASFELQPYFDKLNGLPSSKELLTTKEYDTYIEALMTHETIMAKSGGDLNNVPLALQDDLKKVRDVLDYVNQKQTR